MAQDTEYEFGSFRLALEWSIDDSRYTKSHSAALHLLRQYAKLLDEKPDLLPKLGPQYLSMLGSMNLVPVRERSTPSKNEATNEQSAADTPASAPAAALGRLRSVRGPQTRVA